MRELGEYLKQMRKAQELSLKEVAEQIKVNKKYLEALEEGNHEALPPEVYVRGFIKAYGQLLGADTEDLYARYEESKPKRSRLGFFQRKPPEKKSIIRKKAIKKKEPTQSKEQNDEDSHRPIQSGVDTGGLKTKHLIFSLIAVIVVVVIISIIRAVGNKPPDANDKSNIASDNITAVNGDVAVETPLDEEELSQEVILPMGDIEPSWAISQAESLILTVRVRKEAWIRVEMDYRTDSKGYINPNKDETFRAKNSFYLTMRDPDLFQLKINGFKMVTGEKLREIAGVPPESQYLEIDVNRSNVIRYLEGYKEIVRPSFLQPGSRVDTTQKDSIQAKPQTRQPNPAQRRNVVRPTPKPQTPDPEQEPKEQKSALMPMGGAR
ncbi:MAG: helix-turn-helix domain-containing protein [Candidatus Zixiibacteriota bacterium]